MSSNNKYLGILQNDGLKLHSVRKYMLVILILVTFITYNVSQLKNDNLLENKSLTLS